MQEALYALSKEADIITKDLYQYKGQSLDPETAQYVRDQFENLKIVQEKISLLIDLRS